MKRSPIPILLLALLVAPLAWGDEETSGEVSFAPCSDCHDEVAAAFAKNPHARAKAPAEGSVCASCHEGGATHAESGDPADITIPKGRAAEDTCTTCHDPAGAGGAEARAHKRATISCESCHTIHGTTKARDLLKQEPNALCASCHPDVASSFKKPYGHRLAPGAMECVSCHAPHGGTREASLAAGSLGGGLPCTDCHGEKAGPFVYEHVSGIVGDCRTCHEPHGSSNPKRLKRAAVAQLCLECHTTLPAGNLGSQPPSFHDLRHPRYQNCTTCHTAVHGSMVSPVLVK